MYRLFSILAVFCLCTTGLHSQSRGFVSYSVQDGLAQSNVIDITEDHWGNLWLATTGGLSKFNGLDFTTYKKQDGLSSNQIFCVTTDHQGSIWLGTDTGVTSYDGHMFHNFELTSLEHDQFVNNILVDRNGITWFTSTSGDLYSLKPGEGPSSEIKHEKTFESKISSLVEVKGFMWLSTYRGEIFKYYQGKFESLSVDLDQAGPVITCMYPDQSGTLWLGTTRGLYKIEDEIAELVHAIHMDSNEFGIFSISEEDHGVIWLGTTSGAFRYSEGSCTPVNGADGLTDNIIYKILRDREGTLWFGSFGHGVYKSLGELFTRLDKGHGLSYDYISSICKGADMDFWFGSYGGGVYHYIPGAEPGLPYNIRNIDHTQGLSNDFVYHMAYDDSGFLWIATAMGLNRYGGNNMVNYYKKDGLPSNRIFSLLKCSDGTMYCGSTAGLTQIDTRTGEFLNFSYPGEKQHNRVRTLIETKDGSLLLGTQGGLKIFNGELISDYFQIDSLKYKSVSAIYQDQTGTIWCGLLDDGILYIDPVTDSVRHITEHEGLSSNIVYSLTMDNFGALWAGTPRGLDKISFDSQGMEVTIRHFGANEGFFGIETNTNAVYRQTDGKIWFGTVAGVYRCDPQMDQFNTLEPITYITGIRLFSQQVDWGTLSDSTSGWFNLPVGLRLPQDQNHLTFNFFANSLKNPERVSYQYTLQNFDREWQPITKTNTAVYTNLPPGKYVFKVRASNNDGVWNKQAASISFEITPPFWKTWWFFTLIAITLGVAGRLYYNIRIKEKLRSLIQVEKLKNEEVAKVRKRVAEDFHDQVGNQLASITVLVQLIQARLSSGNMQVEELLSKLGQFTKTLFTGTRDFIWSIDPKSDNVNEMLIYIRDFGEELFEYSEVNFHVETNNSFDAKLKLPVGWSRHVVFIFKEALTNSLKHANCKNVYLSFNVTDHNFVFELKDDGIGLNGYKNGDIPGMGLQNMQERARQIGGQIVITTENDQGTVVTLEGKIPQNEG